MYESYVSASAVSTIRLYSTLERIFEFRSEFRYPVLTRTLNVVYS